MHIVPPYQKPEVIIEAVASPSESLDVTKVLQTPIPSTPSEGKLAGAVAPTAEKIADKRTMEPLDHTTLKEDKHRLLKDNLLFLKIAAKEG